MKILLTGATGYIGKRLLPVLVEQGHHVVCCVRDIERFKIPNLLVTNVEVIEVDFLDSTSLAKIPKDIDGAYYLVHSMSSSNKYEILEKNSAINFRNRLNQTNVKHVVYLSGIVNDRHLSKHLASRLTVEKELGQGNYNFTTLRAGIIIGSGSASFELIRDLVEKFPLMITPNWLKTRCQPIGVSDVIKFLSKIIFNSKTYNHNFDIGGRDVLSYKEMLLEYGRMRGLKRTILVLPLLIPKISYYWLYLVTSTSYKLATELVDSMKVEVVCKNDKINRILKISPISYRESLEKAFTRIKNNEIISSWKDALASGRINFSISEFIKVPSHGCFVDQRSKKIKNRDDTIQKIWRIGGKNGWYYVNWLWHFRGFIDKLSGGIGLRRGRTNESDLKPGDAVDFWRVLYSDKIEGRLLLYAEMKLPGEAWLEFKIINDECIQTATFRPRGLFGRLYWYSVYPFHGIIFRGMLNRLTGN